MDSAIKSERLKAGMSVQQLADVIGVHPNTVRGWERGDYEPTGKNLVQLNTLFGCSPEYLLGMKQQESGGAK